MHEIFMYKCNTKIRLFMRNLKEKMFSNILFSYEKTRFIACNNLCFIGRRINQSQDNYMNVCFISHSTSCEATSFPMGHCLGFGSGFRVSQRTLKKYRTGSTPERVKKKCGPDPNKIVASDYFSLYLGEDVKKCQN